MSPQAPALVCSNCGSEFTATFTGSTCPDCGTGLVTPASLIAEAPPPPPEEFTDPHGLRWMNAGAGWAYWNGEKWVLSPAPPPGYGHTAEKRRHIKHPVWWSILAVLVVVVAIAVWVNDSNHTPNKGDPGLSLHTLSASVRQQIVGTGKDTFHVTGVHKVICNPPNAWKPGSKFYCYAYNSNTRELGKYVGIIEPEQDGYQQWNAHWQPYLLTTTYATTST